jgi:hypothetical protein
MAHWAHRFRLASRGSSLGLLAGVVGCACSTIQRLDSESPGTPSSAWSGRLGFSQTGVLGEDRIIRIRVGDLASLGRKDNRLVLPSGYWGDEVVDLDRSSEEQ